MNYEEKRAKLQNDIHNLKARLQVAQKELGIAQHEIDRHAALISPVRRIPPHLLRDIFALAGPATDTLPANDMILHAPWTMLKVCRHWTEVCFMYGSLWSHVVISSSSRKMSHIGELPLPENPNGPPPNALIAFEREQDLAASANFTARSADLLEAQLQRSRDADLFVRICHAQPFLRTLLPHLHRVKDLTIPHHILADLHIFQPLSRLSFLDIDYSHSLESTQEETDHLQGLLELSAHPITSATFNGSKFGLVRTRPPSYLYRPELLTRITVKSGGC